MDFQLHRIVQRELIGRRREKSLGGFYFYEKMSRFTSFLESFSSKSAILLTSISRSVYLLLLPNEYQEYPSNAAIATLQRWGVARDRFEAVFLYRTTESLTTSYLKTSSCSIYVHCGIYMEQKSCCCLIKLVAATGTSNVGKSPTRGRGKQAIFRFPNRKFKGVWWMPRLREGDEGRGVAAIRFGEVPSNL